MRTNLRTLISIALASALFLSACGDDADTTADGEPAVTEPAITEPADSGTDAADETREFVDGNGDTIVIPTEPTNIVACGYAVLPLIQAEAPLAAVCEWTRELDNMDAETLAAYEAIPKVAVDADVSTLNYEGVAAAAPDLIILGVPAPAMADVRLDVLTDIAPVVVLAPTAPGDWRELGDRFADAAGVADRYGESRDEYNVLVAEINAEFADLFADTTFGGICAACGLAEGMVMREFASSYVTNLFDDLDATFPGVAEGSHAGGCLNGAAGGCVR